MRCHHADEFQQKLLFDLRIVTPPYVSNSHDLVVLGQSLFRSGSLCYCRKRNFYQGHTSLKRLLIAWEIPMYVGAVYFLCAQTAKTSPSQWMYRNVLSIYASDPASPQHDLGPHGPSGMTLVSQFKIWNSGCCLSFWLPIRWARIQALAPALVPMSLDHDSRNASLLAQAKTNVGDLFRWRTRVRVIDVHGEETVEWQSPEPRMFGLPIVLDGD